jgi:hypothetical protein
MAETMHAPVVLFAYNRPDHLRRTIESLKRCEGYAQTPIFLFADAARTPAETDRVAATRLVAAELLGQGAEFRFAEENRGLSRSIIEGVGEIVERYGRVIVIEDDLLLSSGFLRYINDALSHYENNEKVFQISGYAFDAPELMCRSQSLLLPLTTTWGWATWARAWQAFDPQANGWESLALDFKLRRRFNLDGTYDYATMLESQMRGRVDSWGIRWYWTVFQAGGLSCFPPRSHVINAGMDGSGTHGAGISRYLKRKEALGTPSGFVPPRENDVEPGAWKAVKTAIRRQNGRLVGDAINKLKQIYHWCGLARNERY